MIPIIAARVGLIAVAACVASPAFAGPAFGVKPGAPISSVKVLSSLSGRYFDIAPPSPNKAFSRYTVVATKETGICQVWAETTYKPAPDRVAFGKLHSTLVTLYGPASSYPGEAYYEAGMDAGWSSKLPPGIKAIDLYHSKSDQGYLVVLAYTFTNYRACRLKGLGAARDGL